MKSPGDAVHLPSRRLIGLFPAAGYARRLPQLSCSKEILPLDGGEGGPPGLRPPVVADCLLGAMAAGGVDEVVAILRPGKDDIPGLLGDLYEDRVPIRYLTIEKSNSILETLDTAYSHCREADIALGFPDVLFTPTTALATTAERYREGGADVVLGLFPGDEPERSDMVETTQNGRVVGIRVKQPAAGLTYTWMLALWGPRFTELLHSFVTELQADTQDISGGEIYPGHLLQKAIAGGLHVDSVTFPGGRCLDIGTPETLSSAAHWLAAE